MCSGDRWEDLTSLWKKRSWTHEAALCESLNSKRVEIFSLVVTCFPSHHRFFSLLALASFFPSFPLSFLSPALRSGLRGDRNVWLCSCCVFCCTLSAVQLYVCKYRYMFVCNHSEVDSPLRWYIFALSPRLVWTQQSRFQLMCLYVCVCFAGMWEASSKPTLISHKNHSHKTGTDGERWERREREERNTSEEAG